MTKNIDDKYISLRDQMLMAHQETLKSIAPVVVDMVNNPPHYNSCPSGVETIRITQHYNFCLGNAIKYILRSNYKGSYVEDLKKAIWYLTKEIERFEAGKVGKI